MNLTIQTKALQKALAKSALLPEINTSDGISHLVHIYRSSGQVLFERASVAGRLTVSHPDPSETPLDLWLPFERFMRVCESLSGETVTLAADEKQVLIKSAGSSAKLCVLPAGFMPSVGVSDGPAFATSLPPAP